MSESQLSDDDVLWLKSDKPTQHQTYRVKDLIQAFGNNPSVSSAWFTSGLIGEVLRVSGGGWQKGRFRFSIEFMPDSEPDELVSDSQPDEEAIS